MANLVEDTGKPLAKKVAVRKIQVYVAGPLKKKGLPWRQVSRRLSNISPRSLASFRPPPTLLPLALAPPFLRSHTPLTPYPVPRRWRPP